MKNPPLLNLYVHGNGAPVVLLHGFLSSSEYWKEVTELTQQRHQVITIDLLGFGNSPKPRRNDYDYDDHIASILATLEHHQITVPFKLVGHSMGALIALRLANQHPEMVRKLVLVNMPVMLGAQEVYDEILKTSMLRKLALRPYTHRVTWPVVKTLFALKLLPRAARRQLVKHRYFFQHTAVSRLRSFHKVIRDAQAEIDLHRVNVETVVIQGLHDRRIYLENLLRNITLAPTVVLEQVPTGHHTPKEMPERIARAID